MNLSKFGFSFSWLFAGGSYELPKGADTKPLRDCCGGTLKKQTVSVSLKEGDVLKDYLFSKFIQ